MTRLCSTEGCDKALSRGNRTGLCRSHNARAISKCPKVREAKAAAVRLHYTKPGARKKSSEAALKSWATAGEDRFEQSRQNGKARAASWTPETMKAAHEKRLAVLFPWLPAGYRALFRDLRRKRFSIEDCRRLIGDQIAADRTKVRPVLVSAPSSFAEKLAKVEQGKAGLIAVVPNLHLVPTIRRAA